MGVDVTRRHGAVATIDNLNNGVVITVEATENVQDELLILKLLAN
jgi:hypothetical protein